MITTIALFLLIPATFIILFIWLWDSYIGKIVAICVVIFYLFLGIITTIVYGTASTEDVLQKEISLVALEDTYSSTGKFFLGSGYVGEIPYFRFLIEEDGFIQLKSIKVEDGVYVKETDTSKGTLFIYSKTAKGWGSLFYIGLKRYYIFEIPKGSIKYSFDIDLN